MEFVIADNAKKDKSALMDYLSADIDIGSQNDFEIIMPRSASKAYEIGAGMFLYADGVEYGGQFTAIATDTASNNVTWRGLTWRGLLMQDIIEPPSGQPYLIVSGECNEVIGQVLASGGGTGAIFTTEPRNTGKTISGYRFDRYINKLKGLTKMLAAVGMRLQVTARTGPPNSPFFVIVEAVPIINYADRIEWSQNSNSAVQIESDKGGINHLICLGSGELAARQRVDLYVRADGSVGTGGKYYTGADERKAVYDYSGVESMEDLISGGTERLKETMNRQSLGVTVTDDYDEIDIGDIIGGRDYDAGISLSKPVTGKILRVQDGKSTIEISVEGEQGDENAIN